ncbi:hypothetical protein BGZ60DRAFT_532720 [Tricladium varicosporioides]|nr:hypothetical protein BGZ60DRAFT_532720 [Hymenoscyphus varicosporioides]
MDTRLRFSQKGVLIASLRTVQLTVGFTTLFLTGYAASIFQGDFFHTFALTFASFSWTLLLLILIFILPHWFPKWNFYWGRLGVEIITLILWLSSFSLLVWECTAGDAAFAVFGDSGNTEFVAYVTASSIKSAIIGLKVATGLACINWVAFAATFVIVSTYWFSQSKRDEFLNN